MKEKRTLKRYFFMLAFCWFLAFAGVNVSQAQIPHLSLKMEGVRLSRVFDAIRQQTSYDFFYSDDQVDAGTIVSVNVENATLDEALRAFMPPQYEYKIEGRYIMINVKTPPPSKPLNPSSPTTKPASGGKSRSVKGSVIDSQGLPIIGAVVMIDGTQKGFMTDQDGNYSIENVPDDASLRFSCLGYSDLVKPVNGSRVLNAILFEDSQTLEEAVAVAFGKQRKESVIGAVSSIKPDQLKAPASNLTTALAGNIAGIISFQRTGEPGADDASFFVRGVTTFGNNKNPLILIDNIELTSTDLARLSPDDIESFSVMKDATATALYGARGANGVILVKTKEGRKGKSKVNIRYETSVSQPTQEVELVNDPVIYMTLHNEAIQTRDPLAPALYSQEKIAKTDKKHPSYKYPYTNWRELMLKDYALNHRLNLNVSGGGSVARYYVAASLKKDSGILNVEGDNNYNNNIDLTTYTLRSNVNVDITKTTELVIRLSGTFDEYTGPTNGGSATYSQIMSANPVLFPAKYDSELLPYATHVLYGNYAAGDYLNPYAEMTKGYKEYGRANMGAQFELTRNFDFITKGLSARMLLNTNRISYYEMSRYCTPYYYSYVGFNTLKGEEQIECLNPDIGTDYLNYSEGIKTVTAKTYFEGGINYNRDFSRHGVSGMLVYQLTNNHQPNASTLQASLPYRNIGLSGRFTYNYDKRYFTEFNFGYNGSERFSKEKRFGFFPAGGLAWVVSNESFFRNIKPIVSNLKLRLSYGLVGNDDIGSNRFLYLSQVNMNSSAYGYAFGLLENGYSRNGIAISRYENPDVGWEVARKTNIALELGIKDELSLTTELYHEYRDNILQPRSAIPASMGLASIPEANVGAAEGRGVDVELNYNKTFVNRSWLQVRANFTYAKSKYLKYEEDSFPNAPWKSHIGYSVNQAWGYIAESLFVDENEVLNSPAQFGNYMAGDIKYVDVCRDGVIDELDMVPIGYPTVPEIIYGFGFSYGFKGFDLSVFFQGLGNESFWISYNNVSPFFDTSSRIGNNQLAKFIADSHWSENNRDAYAVWPRLAPTMVENNNKRNTWFMRDGSFLRLKQLECGYTFPAKMTRIIGIENMRLYFSGSNLFCFSKFKLWDPEMGSDGLGYPIQRVINVGLNINF